MYEGDRERGWREGMELREGHMRERMEHRHRVGMRGQDEHRTTAEGGQGEEGAKGLP